MCDCITMGVLCVFLFLVCWLCVFVCVSVCVCVCVCACCVSEVTNTSRYCTPTVHHMMSHPFLPP